MRKGKCLIMLCCCLLTIGSYAQQIINVSSLGLKSDTKENAIPFLKKALQQARQYPSSRIVFPKGVYHFIPDMNTTPSDKTYIANEFIDFKNLVIDGEGSEFIFHGRTIPFSISKSENITLKSFSVDYDRPMVTQAEFVLVSDTAIHLKIDKKQYPYEIVDKKVWYYGTGWRSDKANYGQVFDKKTGNIIPQTHDEPAGKFYTQEAKEIKPGIISFKGPFNWIKRPEVSNIITIYNYIYAANSFQFDGCKDVNIKDVILYHGGSLAVYATATENISVDNLDIIARESKQRLFANMADGFHLKGCKGLIKIENCEFNGGGDDFVNVHNMYAPIEEKLSANKLLVRSFKGFHFGEGEGVWYVDVKTGQKVASNYIKTIKLVSGSNWKGVFEVEFEKPVPDLVDTADVMESAEWLPSVIIRNNRVMKRHRGTGIRATTPKSVLIEGNYFNTAGHALLIEGDLEGWMESGANEDMVIRNNVFDNCMTSGSVTGSRWEWGEAVIDITPSVRPTDEKSQPFHRNIIITNNKFLYFDYPVLRARSVDNLQFTNNTLIRTYAYKPYTVVKSNFLLEGCRNVKISGNQFSKDFLGKNISTTFMTKDDLVIDPKQGLSWETNGNKYTQKLEW